MATDQLQIKKNKKYIFVKLFISFLKSPLVVNNASSETLDLPDTGAQSFTIP